MRQSEPMRVRPSNCTNGSMTVSEPISISLSITQVAGYWIVAPAAINSRHFAMRRCWSSATSSAHGKMPRSEEHTSELQSHSDLVCRLLLEKKKKNKKKNEKE